MRDGRTVWRNHRVVHTFALVSRTEWERGTLSRRVRVAMITGRGAIWSVGMMTWVRG